MRVVLDTNVIVSALLNPNGTPASVLAAILAGDSILLHDSRLLTEYREVLSRPHFKFAPEMVDCVVSALFEVGEKIDAPLLAIPLPDPDDLPFLEVAIAGRADAIVTGNVRHFPATICAVLILSPASFLEQIEL
jgi:putative PIN family toxin of toxin-antitoxin system